MANTSAPKRKLISLSTRVHQKAGRRGCSQKVYSPPPPTTFKSFKFHFLPENILAILMRFAFTHVRISLLNCTKGISYADRIPKKGFPHHEEFPTGRIQPPPPPSVIDAGGEPLFKNTSGTLLYGKFTPSLEQRMNMWVEGWGLVRGMKTLALV